MLEILTQDKQQITSALKSLPYSIILPTDEQVSSLQKTDIGEEVERDIHSLNNFFSFIEEYHDQSIIALIGMVNAGKSALGNYLAYRGESEIFEEAPVRQTAKATQARLDQNRILIDLPGLDSVLSATDDQIVKENIRKANLLLVVISVHTPITKHLYDFIKSDEVLKTWDAQRIIIVLNKLDIWDAFPETHRKKQLANYINFLKNGNSDMDFPGINNLFDYEVPIIPFSVIHARYGIDTWRENALHQAISNALVDSSKSCIMRAGQELIQYGIKYGFLVGAYYAMLQKIEEIAQSINSLSSRLIDDLNRVISSEQSSLYSTLGSLKSSCFDDMARCQPDDAESFWQGEYYQQKKSRMQSYRDTKQSQCRNAFDTFTGNIRDSLVMLIKGTFGECSYLYLPDKDRVNEALNALIYKIWDLFDDVYFCDQSYYSSRVQNKLEAINNSLTQSLFSAINNWMDNLLEQVDRALQEAKNNYFKRKAGQYITACNNLEFFCNLFKETETFKQLVMISQASN